MNTFQVSNTDKRAIPIVNTGVIPFGGRIVVNPTIEEVIEFPSSINNMTVTNLGEGVINISFEDIVANADSYALYPNQSITGIKCSKLRLYANAVVSEVQYIGGVSNGI